MTEPQPSKFRAIQPRTSRFTTRTIACVIALLPFSAAGILIGEFVFSIPIAVATLVPFTFLIGGAFSKSVLVYSLFLVWALATCVGRFDPSDYLVSFFAMVAMSFPLAAIAPSHGLRRHVLMGVKVGVALTIALVVVFMIGQFVAGTTVRQLFETVFPYGNTGFFLSYERPKAGFTEPANMAIYLTACFVALDLSGENSVWTKVLKYGALLTIMISGALSGILLVSAYLFFSFLRVANLRKLVSRGMSSGGFVALLLFLIAVPFAFTFLGGAAEALLARIVTTVGAVQDSEFVGSEGSRANAIPVMFLYWQSEGLNALLLGTGYANYENWLIVQFRDLHTALSAFARGHMNNAFAVIGMSMGLPGLLIYCLFLRSIALRSSGRYQIPSLVTIVGIHFVFGGLVYPLLWYSMLIILVSGQNFSASHRVRRSNSSSGLGAHLRSTSPPVASPS